MAAVCLVSSRGRVSEDRIKRNTKSEEGITRQASKALQVTESCSFYSKQRGHHWRFGNSVHTATGRPVKR